MATGAGLIIKKGSADTLKKGAIGTGPFMFTGYRQGVGLTLRRYDNYWGKKPALKTVEIHYITDVSSLFSQFKAGQLDMIQPPPGQPQTDTVKTDPRFKVVNVKAASKTYLALNGKVPAFQDQRVRQAIAMTVDRQALIDTTLNGDGTPICVIAGPGEPGFTKDCPYPHDPARAKALLAETGAKDLTVDFKMVREWGNDTPDLVRSFLQPIGVNVKYVQRDWPKYSEEVLTNPDFQMTYLAGPQQIDAWRCPKGWFLETCDPKVDRLLDQADASSSQKEYADLRKQALLLFAKDAWLIPYDVWSQTLAMKKAIAGFSPTTIPMDQLDVRNIHWTKGNG
jgi:peptide/nickel transport system substrate-binding protein